MKQAVIIFGLGAQIKRSGKLAKTLSNRGYKIIIFDPLDLCVDSRPMDVLTNIDLVVGISLGGLWAQKLVAKFPRSKLVLIASFSGIGRETKLINKMVFWLNKDWVIKILNLSKKMRTEMLVWIYKQVNKIPRKANEETKHIYEYEMLRNIEYFKNLSVNQIKTAVDNVSSVDNRELLKKIKNKTLIFAGNNDDFCPLSVAKSMNRRIKNSKLVISDGGHFNVFTDNSYIEFEKFL